jgi:hypothetical protein
MGHTSIVGAAVAALVLAVTSSASVRVSDYPLMCGRASGPLVVTVPAAVTVSPSLSAVSVRVNTAAAASVAVHGRTVTVGTSRPPGVSCMSIVLGVLDLRFSSGVHGKAGAYAATVTHGPHTYRAKLTIP